MPGLHTTRWIALTLALLAGLWACASGSPTHVVDTTPARRNPLEGAIVLELDVPHWQEICVRAQPAVAHFYNCVTVGDLRAVLEKHRRANNWRPFTAQAAPRAEHTIRP